MTLIQYITLEKMTLMSGKTNFIDMYIHHLFPRVSKFLFSLDFLIELHVARGESTQVLTLCVV